MAAKIVVFIHGMFMTPLCWEHWIPSAEGQGYRCLAPAWPGRSRPVAALRAAHPDPAVGRLTLDAVLIGHSMGGLIVRQLLPHAGLGWPSTRSRQRVRQAVDVARRRWKRALQPTKRSPPMFGHECKAKRDIPPLHLHLLTCRHADGETVVILCLYR